ncbi:MAG TPA: NAD(P)-binding domain-containing protein [Steroidobacteraceae bacterium]|nr:NAD(P)-binding domain-containing protein [Steroidobacteraceae bacterium]
MTYGIVGVGAIASAIVTGLCERAQDAPRIVLSPRNPERVADLASRFPTVRVARSNQEVIDESTVVLLCLRPQDALSVLPALKFSAQQAIVSAMAGIQVAALRELVAPAQNVARVIPLPSVATREGATPVFPATEAAKTLFDRLGAAIEIPHERAFEATSASTATIAAHFAYLNTICRWLVAQGVSEKAARQQVAATFGGLAAQLRGHVSDFAEEARDHATAGGINEQFLHDLEQARVFDAVEGGLNRVLERLAGRSA